MNSEPKYKKIASLLQEELLLKKYNPGDKFYSEAQLKQLYGISSTTAVRVLNILASKNLITRIQGKGTFVAMEKHDIQTSFTDLSFSHGGNEATKVISLVKENDISVLKIMRPTKDYYFKIVRVRYINNDPSEVTISNVNPDYVMGDLRNIQEFQSLYSKISKDTNINPFQLGYSQEATATYLKNRELLDFLNEHDPIPVIKQIRKTKLHNSETLLDYVVSYKKIQYWGFKITVPEQI